jgi:hypothetical protein
MVSVWGLGEVCRIVATPDRFADDDAIEENYS